MFPWFGTLKAQGNAASLLAEAKYQSFLNSRNRLYYQVAAAYYPLYELKQMQQIENENIKILQSYKTIANNKFGNGNGPMVDVLRVDIMLKDAVTNLRVLRDKEKGLKAAFNQLLNRQEEAAVSVPDSLTVEILPEDFRKDSLFNNNPVLDGLELKIKASHASETAAVKQGMPKLGVGLDYIIVGERQDLEPGMAAPPDNGKDAIMPMVSVTLPVFRKKYDASVKEARLMQESYALQKEEYVNSLNAGYEMVRFKIQEQRHLLELYQQQIEESNQILRLLFSAYGNSGKDFEEVLRMQQELLKYQKMKATAEAQLYIALRRVRLFNFESKITWNIKIITMPVITRLLNRILITIIVSTVITVAMTTIVIMRR